MLHYKLNPLNKLVYRFGPNGASHFWAESYCWLSSKITLEESLEEKWRPASIPMIEQPLTIKNITAILQMLKDDPVKPSKLKVTFVATSRSCWTYNIQPEVDLTQDFKHYTTIYLYPISNTHKLAHTVAYSLKLSLKNATN